MIVALIIASFTVISRRHRQEIVHSLPSVTPGTPSKLSPTQGSSSNPQKTEKFWKLYLFIYLACMGTCHSVCERTTYSVSSLPSPRLQDRELQALASAADTSPSEVSSQPRRQKSWWGAIFLVALRMVTWFYCLSRRDINSLEAEVALWQLKTIEWSHALAQLQQARNTSFKP